MIGSLTLDQLRVLVAIEDTGSFSAAGRRLRRVQSAISHTVQTLEEAQGLLLFDRSSRTPRFTEAGRALAAQARQVLRQAEVFERTAQAIAAGLEPELPIAIDSFVPTPPVIRSFAGLQAQHPDLAVTLYTEGMGSAERPGPSYSVVSTRLWRFVDIARRLEFLLAGFGWGTMPRHLVQAHLDAGSLVALNIDDPGVTPPSIGLFAVHDRKRPLGIGARWLLAELQRQTWLGGGEPGPQTSGTVGACT
ncbi:LysR family transcriptional regulator [Sphaerotilus sp.]|uniref:LysR family transcriptional regulator n=1 Tax=Sphaerotilus sp. TaxID=2093942 RepID=UPI002ACE57D1|nr:LysR family transcriptional regulator [Sphaerotilus sp.]MDZ7858871.1 LysR family transcriptional regulator [Sphaerotilus sp.]